MNPLPPERVDRIEVRNNFAMETSDDAGCASAVSPWDVKDLIAEVRRLRARHEAGGPGDDRAGE
jgi:hypothetical protein